MYTSVLPANSLPPDSIISVPVKIIWSKCGNCWPNHVEYYEHADNFIDSWIFDLKRRSPLSKFSEFSNKLCYLPALNITDFVPTIDIPIDIYWKDPTEKFIKIRDDESFTSALNVGGHLIQFTNFLMEFVMVPPYRIQSFD